MVTVVIPAFNRIQLLARAVRSALHQTYQDIEVIVVDDGSTEDVGGALEGFDDPRLSYSHREENLGISAARNRGVSMSHGEFVAFLDSDDEWREGKVSAQLERMEALGSGFRACYTNLEFVDDTLGKTLKQTRYHEEGDLRAFFLRYREIASSLLMEKDAFEEAGGFDVRIDWGEDWDLYLRLAQISGYACVEEPMTIYHLHGLGRVSDTLDKNPKIADSLMVLYDKNRDLFSKDQKARGSILVDIGYYLADSGRKRQALKPFLSSICHLPIQKAAYLSIARLMKGWDSPVRET